MDSMTCRRIAFKNEIIFKLGAGPEAALSRKRFGNLSLPPFAFPPFHPHHNAEMGTANLGPPNPKSSNS